MSYKARYMCEETHDEYVAGQMYTIEEGGMEDDFGIDCRTWKVEGKDVDISKFHCVHINIKQEID